MQLPISSSRICSFSSSNHPGLNFSFASCACSLVRSGSIPTAMQLGLQCCINSIGSMGFLCLKMVFRKLNAKQSKYEGWFITWMILPKAALASSLPSLVSSFLLKAQSSVTRGRISSTEVYTKEKRRTMSPCEYIKMSEHSFTYQEEGTQFTEKPSFEVCSSNAAYNTAHG